MNFNLDEIVQATGAVIHRGSMALPVGKISTDTRTIQMGETFIALDGKNFRGADFVKTALERGAKGIICSSPFEFSDFPEDAFYLQVPDTTKALGDVACEWRRVVDPTVVAVTGSAGKTTTKEMLNFICRPVLATLATEGNLNNLIGLPHMLLRLKEEHELGIFETGMNHPGELTRLTEICIPDVAVITNIGNAHIGNFGTMEDLIRREAEIFEAMPKTGTAIVNADCPHASIMAEAFNIPSLVISYGQNKKADVQATNVQVLPPFGYEFDLHILEVTRRVRLNVFGRYQIMNALAASAACTMLGIGADQIVQRLAEFQPPTMRSQTEWFDGVFIVTDCYNASPDAMVTSVRSILDVAGLKRRIAVLGDMYELGDFTEKFHRQVGIAVAEARLDLLVTVGQHAWSISEEASLRGIESRHFLDAEDAAAFLSDVVKPDDGMVIKGSRGIKLENVLNRFKQLRSEIREGISPIVFQDTTHA